MSNAAAADDSIPNQSAYQRATTPTQKATIDQFRIHGLSAFAKAPQEVLRQWLKTGVNATRTTLGIYPRPLELYVYPKKSNQPVPWAHTRRDKHESIHFYVDTQFSLESFVADWTVYHEMAHMAIPFVGEDYAWFSEGFASYMQYQIMAQNGMLTLPIEQAYANKIGPQLKWFQSDSNAAFIATHLMKKRQFPAAYWGAAWFFVLADTQLRNKHQLTLTQVISRYQQAGRRTDDSIQALLSSLDTLISDTLFNDLLIQFEQQPAHTLYPVDWSEPSQKAD
ncbi:hypothetical protein [Paraglaciecola hydrolytica]|nr:hypothetical protein [Paraglaciecola hydrolytica]